MDVIGRVDSYFEDKAAIDKRQIITAEKIIEYEKCCKNIFAFDDAVQYFIIVCTRQKSGNGWCDEKQWKDLYRGGSMPYHFNWFIYLCLECGQENIEDWKGVVVEMLNNDLLYKSATPVKFNACTKAGNQKNNYYK